MLILLKFPTPITRKMKEEKIADVEGGIEGRSTELEIILEQCHTTLG